MSAPPTPDSRLESAPRGVRWLAVVLALVAIVAYRGALRAPFLFDDDVAIRDNPTIQNLADIGRVLAPPRNGSGVSGRPVVNLSLAIDRAISGESARGFHATNILFHLATGLLLFGVVRRTLSQPRLRARFGATASPLGFACAALWLVHPLQTESVTCVIQRTEVLLGFFYLLTLYAFLRSIDSDSHAWRGLSVVACFLGMATKEVMVSAPLMVLLFDRTFVAGTLATAWRRRRGLHLALASSWLLLVFLVVGGGGTRGVAAGLGLGVSSWSYALKQCEAVLLYAKLTLWPHPLVLFYGTDVVQRLSEVWWQFGVLTLAVVATLVALWRRPLIGFVAFWFFAILAPSSSVVPLVTQTMAEHRMYLPLAAPLAWLACALAVITGRRGFPLLVALALALALLTIRRNGDYRSAVSIWNDTAAKRPDVPAARVNFGEALQHAGRDAEALREYRAVRQLPAEGLNNLATLLLKSGQPADAIPVCEQALRLKPDFAAAHNNLGSALCRLGRNDDGVQHIRTALRLQPTLAAAHSNLAGALVHEKNYADAATEAEAALRLEPTLRDAHVNLVDALFSLGRPAEAIPHLEAVLRQTPNDAATWSNLGAVLYQIGRAQDAIGPLRKALALNPDLVAAHNNLGSALVQTGEFAEAAAHYRAALRLDPESADTHCNLGLALLRLGQTTEARAEFTTALKLNPQHAAARGNLAALEAAGAESPRRQP